MAEFEYFPSTQRPPAFIAKVVSIFGKHASSISALSKKSRASSDEVLSLVCADLEALKFVVEKGKTRLGQIQRPVFCGRNGKPKLQYQVDSYHHKYRCGLEVERGRSIMGNAFYRDLVQAM